MQGKPGAACALTRNLRGLGGRAGRFGRNVTGVVMTSRVLATFGASIVLIVVGLAYLYRYEPIPSFNAGQVVLIWGTPIQGYLVWDRWMHRICVTGLHYEHSQTIACSLEEARQMHPWAKDEIVVPAGR